MFEININFIAMEVKLILINIQYKALLCLLSLSPAETIYLL